MKNVAENLEQAAVQQQCRSLRLPAVGGQCSPLADVAVKQRQTYLRYLEAGSGRLHRTREPIILIGDCGTGKTHLLTGLCVACAEFHLRVPYRTRYEKLECRLLVQID